MRIELAVAISVNRIVTTVAIQTYFSFSSKSNTTRGIFSELVLLVEELVV